MAPIQFNLPDGTTVGVEDVDMRRVYDILWDLSDLPGAISAAAALLYESRRPAGLRQLVGLTAVQGEAMRQALAHFASAS